MQPDEGHEGDAERKVAWEKGFWLMFADRHKARLADEADQKHQTWPKKPPNEQNSKLPANAATINSSKFFYEKVDDKSPFFL